MQQKRVDEMLRSFNETVARCVHLEHEIPTLKKLVKSLRETLLEDEISTTSVLSDMPHGTIISNPTERLGLKIASGYVSEDILDLEKEIREKEIELEELRPNVIYVETWMRGLNEREKFLVERKQIAGEFWRVIADEFRERFGAEYSKNGLKNIYTSAMEKIYRIAQ